MNRIGLYYRTRNILLNAYHNKTLWNSDDCACAVANIIAANLGYAVVPSPQCPGLYAWKQNGDFVTPDFPEILRHYYLGEKCEPHECGFQQIESTGYTIKELRQIEAAFEGPWWLPDRRPKRKSRLRAKRGMYAVIEVLDIIHEVEDPLVRRERNAYRQRKAVRVMTTMAVLLVLILT